MPGSGRIVSERDNEAKNEPVTTQREHGDVAGAAAETQDPGKAGDAHGGALPHPRARNAKEAAAAAGPEEISEAKRDIAPGGTIETALTPSGEPSVVASQLLWDGSSATSRVDEVIAEAEREDRG